MFTKNPTKLDSVSKAALKILNEAGAQSRKSSPAYRSSEHITIHHHGESGPEKTRVWFKGTPREALDNAKNYAIKKGLKVIKYRIQQRGRNHEAMERRAAQFRAQNNLTGPFRPGRESISKPEGHYSGIMPVHYAHPLRGHLERLKAEKKQLDRKMATTLKGKANKKTSVKGMKKRAYETRPEGKGISGEKLLRYTKADHGARDKRKKDIAIKHIAALRAGHAAGLQTRTSANRWISSEDLDLAQDANKRALKSSKSRKDRLNQAKRILRNRRNAHARRNWELNQE